MKNQNTLSVLIVGESGEFTASSRVLAQNLSTTPGVEAVFVRTSAQDAPTFPSLVDCPVVEGPGWNLRECITEALRRTTGDWVLLMQPNEFLLSDSLPQLLMTLQASVEGVRHGSTALVHEDGSSNSRHHGAPECAYPLLGRWWLHSLHPHPSALFMRRPLALKALELTAHHHKFTRYGLALGITRCCPSTALNLCTSSAPFDQLNSSEEERERVVIVRQELSLHSIPEQGALWRDYYISRLTEAPLHRLPALLPHSRAQAHALASLLGGSTPPMGEVLWNIYRDIGLSKEAVVYLSKWSSITENGTAAPSTSRHDVLMKKTLSDEFQRKSTGVNNILLLTENLSNSPLATVAHLLREQGKKRTTLYTLSYNEDEYQNIFADLAHRGLLGWIRPAIAKKLRPRLENGQQPPESFISQFNISHQVPQRSLAPVLEDTQGCLDYVIADIDAPFISAELEHLAEHVKNSHTIVLQGQLTASKIGPIEESIRRHRPLESMISHGEITIITCGAYPVR